jgi:hypothetical protein
MEDGNKKPIYRFDLQVDASLNQAMVCCKPSGNGVIARQPNSASAREVSRRRDSSTN